MTSGGFLATHVAPPDGLQAWDQPDGTRPVVATVQPGVRMQLVEQRGAWGRVLFSNGWQGWVDARRLVAVPAPQPRPPAAPQFRPAEPPAQQQSPWERAVERPAERPAEQPAAEGPAAQPQPAPEPEPKPEAQWTAEIDDPFQLPPQSRPAAEPSLFSEKPAPARPAAPAVPEEKKPKPERPKPRTPSAPTSRLPTFDLGSVTISAGGIGAVLVLFGSLLPWISLKGFSGNAFRVPIKFLVDYKTSGGGFKLGLLLVAAAVVAGVFFVLPGQVRLRRIMGVVVILIAVLYTIQLQRALSAFPDAPSLFSGIGKFGLLFTIVGGVGLIIDKSEPASG